MIRTFKYLYEETKQYDRKILLCIVGNVAADVLNVWLNVAMTGILLLLLEKGSTGRAAEAVLVFSVLNFGLSILKKYLFMRMKIVGARIDSGLNISVFQNMLKLEYEKQEKEETKKQYEFADTAINEIGIFKIVQQLMSVSGSVINIALASVAVSFLNVWLILAAVIAAGINISGELFRMKCRYEANQERAELEWNMYYVRDYLSSFRFAKEIRIFGMRDYVLEKLKYFIGRYTKISVEAEKKYVKKYGFSYILDGILLTFVYFFGIYEFTSGHIGTGALAVYLSSMTAMMAAVMKLVKNAAGLTENSRYMRALQEFLKSGKEKEEKGADAWGSGKKLVIEFEDVSFCYPGTQKEILKNLTFRIGDGEKIAIVGKNGAGKTTLIYLLLGLYKPTSGRILMNGTDYTLLSQETVCRAFSVVLQDFGIYPFSVFSNISMGEERNIDRVRECVKKVGLSEKIAELKYQGDTFLSQELDEDGVELSGGEAQKLAMARALYRDSPALVLDEPTAALSPKNEYDIYAGFRELSREKTTIFISHKLAMCRLCDRIMVLDDGIIKQIGSHEELMKSNNLYSEMFRMQAESFRF